MTNTLTADGNADFIGVYTLKYIGTDNVPQDTEIAFKFEIQPCYYKCSLCNSNDFDDCTECQPGYFLYGSNCLDACLPGFWENDPAHECESCNELCSTCTGPDALSDCGACAPGYFYQDNSCYLTCPDGYYGDELTGLCKTCNSACTKCFGASVTQCTECVEGEYLLSDTSCKKPYCLSGYYFNWNPTVMGCVACHEKCRQCTGATSTMCTSCNLGMIFQQNEIQTTTEQLGTCLTCTEFVEGYVMDENYNCIDYCGDGLTIDSACDDGNNKNGDGCDENCSIEYGFDCKLQANTTATCFENIRPEMEISYVSSENVLTLKFSEYVNITSNDTITEENLLVQI